MCTPPSSQGSVDTVILSQGSDFFEGGDLRPLPRELLTDYIPSEEERGFTEKMLAKRPIPALSVNDTVCAAKDGKLESEHGIAHIFEDGEIVCIFPFEASEEIGRRYDWRKSGTSTPIMTHRTKFGVWVIQQQTQRGCAAAGNMLRKDRGIEIDFASLLTWNCRSIELAIASLRKSGLRVVVSEVGRGDIDGLKDLTDRRGPAMVQLDGEDFGSHTIIVDGIGNGRALIRDPYHGLQMLVKTEALERHFVGGQVVQTLSD